MPAPKQPQDHLPKKQQAPGPFTFDHGGTTFVLPAPSAALDVIPGRALRDAVMEGGEAEVRLGFVMVEAVGAAPEALDALYALPVSEMTRVVERWMRSADASGATLPQS